MNPSWMLQTFRIAGIDRSTPCKLDLPSIDANERRCAEMQDGTFQSITLRKSDDLLLVKNGGAQ